MSNFEKLSSFLGNHRVKKTISEGEVFTTYTHVTKKTPNSCSGSYNIPNDKIDAFLTTYCNVVNKSIWASVAEKPSNHAPLRVDMDFKSDLAHGSERHYTEEHLKELVKFYQIEISNITEELTDETLTCIVLEKKRPRIEKDAVKDGFHLHFPNFICEPRIQDYILRDKVIGRLKQSELWRNTKYITPVEDMIDRDIGHKVWMLYGSMNYKSDESTPYLYERPQGGPNDPWKTCTQPYGHVYNHNLEEIKMMEVFESDMVNRKNSIKYYLPRFLSIRGYNESTKLKKFAKEAVIVSNHKKQIIRKRKGVQKKRGVEEALEDIKIIKNGDIMEMLSSERADNYGDWIDVGWTLFNIGQGHEEALKLWIDFSQKSHKFEEGVCENEWNRMEIRDKSLGSLLMMAKNDNPVMYKEWKDTNINHYLYKSVEEKQPTEYDLSMVVYSMFKDRFCCAYGKKDIWYEFRDHRWHLMDDGLGLKRLLVTDVLDKYLEFKKELIDRRLEAKDELSVKMFDEKEKRASVICNKLKTIGFHDKILKMCKLNMEDSKFLKKMNENKKILVCENGVLDLELGIFREGRPDDYATFSTGLIYDDRYSHHDEDVKNVKLFLKKVFPNENRRKYFTDMATSCLQGGNVHKRFIIGTGCGDNSKSVTYTLLELVFGEYYGKFPRELLISGQNGSSAGARPELSRVRGKRVMSMQEITHRDNINIGVLKELTGNDSFFARGLFEMGGEITPQYTLWMQCNAPPKVPGHDDATWSRIRVLDFESKFVKPQDREKFPVPETLEEQMKMKRFEADPTFMDYLPEMAPALLWLLFDNFINNYKHNGLNEPKEVMTATNEYKANNDVYMEFISEKIIKVEGEDDDKYMDNFVTLSVMFDEFKEWYRENYPSYKNSIGKNKFRDSLKKLLGTTTTCKRGFKGGKFYGYELSDSEL